MTLVRFRSKNIPISSRNIANCKTLSPKLIVIAVTYVKLDILHHRTDDSM